MDDLGELPGDIFESIDEVPIAAASLSQVHRAVLKTGEIVAVKVQRPNAQSMIESDLGLLHFAANWINEHASLETWFDPRAVVTEFERSVKRELNFQTELRHIRLFRNNFELDETVHIPLVYAELSTRRILIMEWIEGISVDDVETLKKAGMDMELIARNGANAILKQIFEDGFFHADPHPGNIFIMPGEVVCFLDYGMAASLDPDDVDAMAEMMAALFKNDAARIVKVVSKVTGARGKVDKSALEREVREYLKLEAEDIVRGFQFGRGLKRVIEIMHHHNLVFLPRFTLLLKSLSVIEQVGRDLDPDFDMLPVIKPHVKKLIRKRYSLPRIFSEFRESLTEFLNLGRSLPGDLRDVFAMLKQGELNVVFRHKGLENLIHIMDAASNRISFSVIIGSLIVGSSLIMTTGQGPLLWGVPAVGLVGYFIAAILGLWLVISIIRSRKL